MSMSEYLYSTGISFLLSGLLAHGPFVICFSGVNLLRMNRNQITNREGWLNGMLVGGLDLLL